jgi:hypothetical protein
MAYPSPSNMGIVITQPKQYDIRSNFGMYPGERLLFHCKLETGCCKLGDTYYTSVTDTRYVSRVEQFICCGCCCKRPSSDKCIYLRDIAELDEVRDGFYCWDWCCDCWCNWCCKHLLNNCFCLCCCCPLLPKRLQLRGAFGTHTIRIHGNDVPDFEFMLTEAIAQHKLPNHY